MSTAPAEPSAGPFFGGPLPQATQAVPRPPLSRASPGSAVPGAFVPDPLHRKLTPAGANPAPVVPASIAGQTIPAPPAALAKRPKGRWFAATLFVLFLSGLGFLGQQLFFQLPCHGVVTGEIVRVSTPWKGVVRTLAVHEGDRVAAGDLLLTLENTSDRLQLERWADELKVAEAELAAKHAELRFQAELRGDRRHKARAEYYENWGLLLQEQAKLTDWEAKRQRNDQLRQRDAVSEVELEGVRLAEEGQRAKVEQLKSSVAEMKRRVESIDRSEATEDELKPKAARIAQIRGEISRLQTVIDQGAIRAPVSGRIVRRACSVGEHLAEAESAVEILADDSLHILAYVPQTRGDELRPGQHVRARVAPHREPILCVVERAALRLDEPPACVARRFTADEPLRHWCLRPLTPVNDLGVGSIAKIGPPFPPPAANRENATAARRKTLP